MLPAQAIDVHAHFLPPVYREALRSAGLTLLDGGMPIPDWSPEAAIALMDEMGIAGAMLSVSSPFAVSLAGEGAEKLCRSVNDYAAEMKAKYPTRFGALAMLPVPFIDQSIAELTRALDKLGLDGVALPTNAAGLYLGSEQLAPLLDALDERGAVVFVHPTSPCCFEAFGLQLPAPMIEFPFDSTRTIVSLLYSRALERRKRIRFIFTHGGGTVPFLASRITRIGGTPLIGNRALPLPQAIEWLARWHYDLASVNTPAQVMALREIAPVSQIVYGTDFPFSPAFGVRLAVAEFPKLPFNDAEHKAVLHGNAARLFPELARQCGCAG
ncbi:amidohydrolase [Sphingobium sp. SCG-1]|uniref:amidohydrolase family protein n=1 Tax=Sphingobium sp. SCG-1 TaxID=2072936 RepID=UPI000CD682F7|nr:amidohydrolase family protein [Sphingobium sp. SCG-1]AUW59293.1 amidohydrolase [Sphingobium sp. SCG-1]